MTQHFTWYHYHHAEPSEVNAVETIKRLTHSHTPNNQQNNTCPQSIYSQVSPTYNELITHSPQNNAIYPHDQSTVFLQQFSMITQELKKFMDKVSGDITKHDTSIHHSLRKCTRKIYTEC